MAASRPQSSPRHKPLKRSGSDWLPPASSSRKGALRGLSATFTGPGTPAFCKPPDPARAASGIACLGVRVRPKSTQRALKYIDFSWKRMSCRKAGGFIRHDAGFLVNAACFSCRVLGFHERDCDVRGPRPLSPRFFRRGLASAACDFQKA